MLSAFFMFRSIDAFGDRLEDHIYNTRSGMQSLFVFFSLGSLGIIHQGKLYHQLSFKPDTTGHYEVAVDESENLKEKADMGRFEILLPISA